MNTYRVKIVYTKALSLKNKLLFNHVDDNKPKSGECRNCGTSWSIL